MPDKSTIPLYEIWETFKATTRGPNRIPDVPIDTPNYLNTHGYFKSESIHFLKPRDHELKCPAKEITKATTWGPRHNILPWLVALSMGKNK